VLPGEKMKISTKDKKEKSVIQQLRDIREEVSLGIKEVISC